MNFQDYERDGAVVLRQAFDREWVNLLLGAVDRAIASPGPFHEEYARGQGRFFEDTYLWKAHPEFRDFAFRSPAAGIAKEVTASERVALFYDQVFVKEPGTHKPTPWHQDRTYWAVSGTQMCTLWLALDRVPKDTCVEFVAGSHLWGGHQARHFLDQRPYRGQESLPILPDIEGRRGEYRILSWEMEPGDCILFHPLAVHGSPGNRSPVNRRRAVATRWIGDDVRFHATGNEFAFPKGELNVTDGEKLPPELAPQVD